jgi:threonine synthase
MNTKIIWVAPEKEHPLWLALRYWVDEYEVNNYEEKSLAEKLTTPFTAVLPILYKIFSEAWNIYTEVSNEDIRKIKNILDKTWLKTENSAAVAFATFISKNRPEIDSNAKIIIVSTWKWLEN